MKFLDFILIGKGYVKRLNLVVISCGKSIVDVDEWACTASQLHSGATVLTQLFRTEYY